MLRIPLFVAITLFLAIATFAHSALSSLTKLPPYRGEADEWVEPDLPLVDHGPVPPLPEGVSVAAQPQGSLNGRIVYSCPGHGWTFSNRWPGEGHPWYTQRGDNHELVEDLGNADQFPFYVNHLFNAGATVVPLRPVGQQDNEVVLDNDDPGVTFAGPWGDSTSRVYFGDPHDAVRYRFAPTTSAGGAPATARYTPDLPEASFYPVYAWARDGDDRAGDQLYRVRHSGGVTDVRVNHRFVGKGWIYLGTHHFNAGAEGFVEISNDSSDTSIANPCVVADAIRFGNGMGDVDRGAGVSGYPRADEASRYWVQRALGQGSPPDPYEIGGSSDESDNVGTPPRASAHMNRESQGTMFDRIFLGMHTNAYDPGTIGLLNGNNVAGTNTPNQARWAELVAAELNDDMSALGTPPLESPWPNRRALERILVYDRGDIEFGEINNSRINNEFDATIVEVAAHGNANEAALCLDPRVRNWTGRAMYQATVRYFNEFDDAPVAMLPEPPTNVRAVGSADGSVTVTWEPSVVDGIGGDAPSGYRVQRSVNGYGFDGGIEVAGADATLLRVADVDNCGPVFFRVVAFNSGGESMPSETVAARAASDQSILIVSGFDRFDRGLCVRQTAGPGIGGLNGGTQTFSRVWPRRMNSFDYPVQVAHAIAAVAPGLGFDTCQNEAVELSQVYLSNYDTVVWLLGREGETLSTAEQGALGTFLTRGGNLFLSGADIALDLGHPEGASSSDRRFLRHMLHADFGVSDVGALSLAAVDGGIFEGNAPLQLDDGTMETYPALDLDSLMPAGRGATQALTYTGGQGGCAAVSWTGGSSPSRVVLFGFPFETIVGASARAQVMGDVLKFFEMM